MILISSKNFSKKFLENWKYVASSFKSIKCCKVSVAPMFTDFSRHFSSL